MSEERKLYVVVGGSVLEAAGGGRSMAQRAYLCRARSPEEALGQAYHSALGKWPPEEGWRPPLLEVGEVPASLAVTLPPAALALLSELQAASACPSGCGEEVLASLSARAVTFLREHAAAVCHAAFTCAPFEAPDLVVGGAP